MNKMDEEEIQLVLYHIIQAKLGREVVLNRAYDNKIERCKISSSGASVILNWFSKTDKVTPAGLWEQIKENSFEVEWD